MQVFRDYQGRTIRLSDDTASHIIETHPEIRRIGLEFVISETLDSPDMVMGSRRDEREHYTISSAAARLLEIDTLASL